MNNNDYKQFENILETQLKLIHNRIENFDTRLNEIDIKVGNHLVGVSKTFNEMEKQLATVTTSLRWIEKIIDIDSNLQRGVQVKKEVDKNGQVNLKISDAEQTVNINWLKWSTRLLIGVIVAESIGLIYFIIKTLI